jgi:hypothetical protein
MDSTTSFGICGNNFYWPRWGPVLHHIFFLVLGCVALTACGDPLAKVERLSDVPVSEDQTVALALPGPEEAADQPSVLSRWFGGKAPEAAPDGTTARTDDASDSFVKTASLADVDAIQGSKKRKPLIGRSFSTGPDAREVTVGTTLPFGEIGRVCAARGSALGREVARFPERGRGYRLYDSAPGTTAPHLFYVTGFRDGCPRQFTAALAIFGAPSMYEQLRYGNASKDRHNSATDKAYEKVKSQVCSVPRRKPCGRKIKSLERDTVFISAYERFESNARWADILVHDSAVLAANIKKN